MPTRSTITLRLNRHQAEWLYWECLSNLEDSVERGVIEPESEASARSVIADLERAIERAKRDAELELHRLRLITTKPEPRS